MGAHRVYANKTATEASVAIVPALTIRCAPVGAVMRDALFDASPTRKPTTWHDARATAITWLAVAGVDAVKVQRRADHTTIETTMGYIREAESCAGEAFGVPLPPLPLELLRDVVEPSLRCAAAARAPSPRWLTHGL